MKIFSPFYYRGQNSLGKHCFRLSFLSLLLSCLLVVSTVDAGVRNFTNTNAVLSLAVEGHTLLAGTEGGLVLWDLKKKNYHTITTSEGLPNNKITSILVDRKKGDWWLGTHRGVCRYNQKRWISYGIKNGLSSMWINKLYRDREGIVWAGTRRGVDWFNNYKWNRLFLNRGHAPSKVYGLVEESNGRWWFADRGKGIFSLDSDFSLKRYERVNNIPSLFNRRVVVDHDGTVWFGTYRGVIAYNGKEWKRYGLSEGLTSFQINEIFVDGKNTLWAGTTHGCSHLVDGRWISLDRKDGLPGDYVTSFAEDAQGRIYIGTRDGIGVFKGGKITSLMTNAPFKGIVFTDGVRRQDGTLWFAATDGGGIVSYDGNKWRTFGSVEGLSDDHVLSLAVDRKDQLWAGTHHGLFRYTSGKWDPVPIGEEKTAVNIYAVAFQKEEILLGTDRGLFILQRGGRRVITKKEGLPDHSVFALLVDGDRCYAGTRAGLAVLKKSGITVIKELKGHEVTSLLKTGAGVLYAGTEYGLFQIEKDHVTRFGVSDGLFDLRIQKLTVDDGGRLWIATQRGLCKFDGAQFECFTRDEGFADDQINSVVLDQKGRKWLATIQGISCFDDVMRFDRSRYVGKAAKTLLTLHDRNLNTDPGREEHIPVVLKNETTGKETRTNLVENGPDSGIFQARWSFAADTVRAGTENVIPVDGERTNRIHAEAGDPATDPVVAVCYWRNDFRTGNLNGDAIISRKDAVLADQVVSGVAHLPLDDKTDLNHDGQVDKLDVEYARQVNSGVLHPWQMIENHGPVLRPRIVASRGEGGEMFPNDDLPWAFQVIQADKGGTIELEDLSLYIPPGALEQDTLITITRGERTPSPSDVSCYPVGPGFNFYPAGLKFRKPLRISLKAQHSDLEKAGVSDLLSLAVGQWNGKGYDALPSYPYFRRNRLIGFLYGFPENLLRPDRPENAKTRTAPIFNYLYRSNYFSLITVQEGGELKVTGSSGSKIERLFSGFKKTDPFRLFLINGKNQALLFDRDNVTLHEGSEIMKALLGRTPFKSSPLGKGSAGKRRIPSAPPFMKGGTGGIVLAPHTPYRIGLIGKDTKGNRATLSSTFYIREPDPLQSLKILPAKVTLARGSRFRFIGLGISNDGTEWPGLDLDWSATGPGASIDATGVFSDTAEGEGIVKASCAGLNASAEYKISGKSELTRILVAPKVQVVRVNEKRDYQAVGVDQYGHRMKIRPQWSLENSGGEGLIDAEGHFTAKREGIYFLKVKEGDVSASVISFIGGCTWCHFMK